MSMSEDREREARNAEPQPKGPSVERKVGRSLGKALGRLRQTKVWKDTAKAYRDGLEGST